MTDSCVVTFTIYISSWKFHQLAAGQLVWYGKGRRYCRPLHKKSRLPGHSIQPARRAAVLGQPSSFRPHCTHTLLILSSANPVSTSSLFLDEFFVNFLFLVLYYSIISAPKAKFRIRILLIRIRIQVFDFI
jgi:hypothetical protein